MSIELLGWLVVIVSTVVVPIGMAALFFWALLTEACEGWLAVILPAIFVLLSVPFIFLLMMFEYWGIIPPGG